MRTSRPLLLWLSCALALPLLVLVAAPALAHSTIASQMTEGVRNDNAVRISHGCGEEGAVIAQSVVFPTDAPDLVASDPSVVVTDLSEVIEQGTLAGLVAGVQDRSIFEKQGEKTDANTNVVGFFGKRGRLAPELSGRVPFQFTPPNFLADSCATKLLVRVAIADICKRKLPNLLPGRANLWIPDNGSRIATEALAAGVEGVGDPATLTVSRNLASNPLPAACGAGFELSVTPSAAQIDRDLPIEGFWPAR